MRGLTDGLVGYTFCSVFVNCFIFIHIDILVRWCVRLTIRTYTYVRIKKKRSLNMTYDVLDSFLFSCFIFRFLDIKHTKRTKINRKKEKRKKEII